MKQFCPLEVPNNLFGQYGGVTFSRANGDLQGKCILVTGASSWLGAHFASLFAARKAEVILVGRRIGVLEEMVQRWRSRSISSSTAGPDTRRAQPLELDVP